MRTTYNELEVGDIVQVVDEPNTNCPFHWADGMSDYLGRTVEISSKSWMPGRETYGYRIKEDSGKYIWCGNCFVYITPDFDAATDDEILSLFVA